MDTLFYIINEGKITMVNYCQVHSTGIFFNNNNLCCTISYFHSINIIKYRMLIVEKILKWSLKFAYHFLFF